jgi:hypothetical protein
MGSQSRGVVDRDACGAHRRGLTHGRVREGHGWCAARSLDRLPRSPNPGAPNRANDVQSASRCPRRTRPRIQPSRPRRNKLTTKGKRRKTATRQEMDDIRLLDLARLWILDSFVLCLMSCVSPPNTRVFRALLLQSGNRRREHDVGDGNRCGTCHDGGRSHWWPEHQRCWPNGVTGLRVARGNVRSPLSLVPRTNQRGRCSLRNMRPAFRLELQLSPIAGRHFEFAIHHDLYHT